MRLWVLEVFTCLKSYTWIEYIFCMKNQLKLLTVRIENYGDILLYFVTLESWRKYLVLVNMTPSTGYNS